MNVAKGNLEENKRLIDILTVNYQSVVRVDYCGGTKFSNFTEYIPESRLTKILAALFIGDKDKVLKGDFGDIIIYEEDCEKLYEDTRRDVVLSKIIEDSLYYVFFRAFVDGQLHYFKIKFAPDVVDGKLTGIVLALMDNGLIEKVKRRRELEIYHQIDDAERTIMEKTAELREKTLALAFANGETIDLLGNIVEYRNQESGLHIKRVKAYTKALAYQFMEDFPEYGLTPESIDNIVSASSLHDLGKIMVPDAILLKKGKFTPEEFEEMKKHCEYGLEILKEAPVSWTTEFTKIARDICYCHHEKYDGKGYPKGLKGEEIPLSAQIVSIADCFDALTNARVYKPAFTVDQSYSMILNGECGAFSDKIISCFKKCRSKFSKIKVNPDHYFEKSLVQLSGENKLKGLNILLVDDSDISLDINCEILENDGAKITTASNGIEAIEKFTKKGPFHAIIMDIVMPVMDGIEATKKIRELEGNSGNRVPIIALSAEGVAIDSLFEIGVDASMAKPLVVGELTRILISCMHNSSVQMQKQLVETLKIANTDALTKVKSVAAFTDMQSSLNGDIKGDNKKMEFAIVLADVNDLKTTNDTFGHETGDIYIKNCASILCNVFSHSPVYRVGGDEFVVALFGKEYKKRLSKIKLLKARLAKAKKIKEYIDGRASLAVGVAEFDPAIDNSVNDVVKRADIEMYKDKKACKAEEDK